MNKREIRDTDRSSVSPEPNLAGRLHLPSAFWALAAVLSAGVFAVYGPALDFQFILDDHRFLGDPRVQSPGHVWEYFTTFAWPQVQGGPLSFYRPLFVSWMRVNYLLCESSSWGWHFLSIAKHVLAAAMLAGLLWILLEHRLAALLAAALFAFHPAQAESVAWVTVPDPIMTAAMLGALVLYLKHEDRLSFGRHSPQVSRKKKSQTPHGDSKSGSTSAWIILSAAIYLAALMAKETAVVLLAVIFADSLRTPFGMRGQTKRDALPESPGIRDQLILALRRVSPFLSVTLLYLFLRTHALKGNISPATQHLHWTTVLLSCPQVLWFYVKVIFWPLRSTAFADCSLVVSFSLRDVVLPGMGVLCATAIIAAICLWAWTTAKRDLSDQEASNATRAILWGTLLLVLPILLALNLNALNPGDFLHGRYAYLPLAGLMLILATAWRVCKNGHLVWLLVCGLVIAAFAVLTLKQESMWRDDLTVFTVAHRNAPNNVPVSRNLMRARVQGALGLAEQDRCDEAIPVLNQAVHDYPEDWFGWAALAECRVKLNDLPQAEPLLRRAYELSNDPRVKEAWQDVRRNMGLPPEP